MDLNAPPKRPSLLGRSSPLQFVLIVALSIAFTVFVLHYSMRFGRLAGDIVPDDSGYFVDGARWLQKFYGDGVQGLWKSFVTTRPHSLWSSALAFVSFLLFGLKDWAPYAGNGVLVAATLWLAVSIVSATPWYLRLGTVIFALTVPFLLNAVHEFRPDFAAGLFTAAGTLSILVGGYERERRATMQGGVLFGLALLAKPAISPLTFAMLALSVGAALALAVDLQWRHLWGPRCFRLVAEALIPVVLVAGLYYALHYKEVVHYIRDTVFAKSGEVWRTEMSVGDSLRYYLSGRGGEAMLGNHASLIGILGFGASALVFWKADRRLRLFFAMLFILLFVSFVIPVFTKNKSVFFGLSFQVLAFFTALLAVATAVRLPWYRPWLLALPAAVVFAGGIYHFPSPPATLAVEEDTLSIRDSRQLNARIVTALADDDLDNRKDQVIFTDVFGYINSATLEWLSLRDGLHFDIDGVKTIEMSDYRKRMGRANYLLLNDVGAYGQATALPNWKLAGELVALIRERPDFQLVCEFPSLNGRSYFLFRNLRPRRLPQFFGWSRAEALHVDGGSRVVLQPRNSLWFTHEREFQLELRAVFHSDAGQHCRIVLNGELIAERTSEAGRKEEFAIRLPAKHGENQLDFHWDPARLRNGTRDLPVSFNRLQLVYDFDALTPLTPESDR